MRLGSLFHNKITVLLYIYYTHSCSSSSTVFEKMDSDNNAASNATSKRAASTHKK